MSLKKMKPVERTEEQLELFVAADFIQYDPALTLTETQQQLLIQHVQSNTKRYERYEVRALSTVFNDFEQNKLTMKNNQRRQRMLTFQANCKCIKCGIEADICIVERVRTELEGARHHNLYAITANGLVLMTVDHYVPDSCGGRYHFDNFQTMCTDCNNGKSNYMSLEEIAEARANKAKYKKEWWNDELFDLVLYIQEQAATAQRADQRKQWYKLLATFKQYTGKFQMEKPQNVPELIDTIKTKIYVLHRSHGVKKCHISVVPAKEQVYTWAFWSAKAKQLYAQIVKELGILKTVKFRSPIVFASKGSPKSARCASTKPSRQKIATVG